LFKRFRGWQCLLTQHPLSVATAHKHAGAAMPTVVSRLRMWLKPGGKFSALNSATAGARTTKV
jgi:hypothetical protein